MAQKSKVSPATSPDKRMVSLRLSTDARAILQSLAEHHGLGRTAVLEQLIRQEGRKVLGRKS